MLNRAEWIKFLGLFFNQDALASTIFDGINATYHETAAEIQVQTGLQSAGARIRPGRHFALDASVPGSGQASCCALLALHAIGAAPGAACARDARACGWAKGLGFSLPGTTWPYGGPLSTEKASKPPKGAGAGRCPSAAALPADVSLARAV